MSKMVWEHLGIPPKALEQVAQEMEVRAFLPRLLLMQPKNHTSGIELGSSWKPTLRTNMYSY